MVKNNAHHIFGLKYLLDYRVLKIINNSTLLLKKKTNGKERKVNVNNVKPSSTTKLVENAWNSFLSSI